MGTKDNLLKKVKKYFSFRKISPLDFRTTREIVPVSPYSGWTGEAILSAIDDFDGGRFQNAELLYHAMTKEPRIGSALEQRVHLIRNFKRSVFIPKDAPERIKKMSYRLDKNFSTIFENHADSEILRRVTMFGFCIARHRYVVCDGMIIPVIVPWTHSSCEWIENERCFYVTTEDGSQVPVIGDPWITFSLGGLRPWLNGAIRKLAQPFWTINQSLDQWSRYNDTEAAALKKIRVPRMTREQREAGAAFALAASLRAGDTYLCPGPKEEFDLEFVTANSRGSAYNSFLDALAQARKEISIVLLGNNLTQDIQGGSLAAATEAFNEKTKISQSDVEFLAEPLYAHTTRLWIEKNFTPEFYGENSLIQYRPKLIWDVDTSKDEKERSESAQKYSQSIQGFFSAAEGAGILDKLDVDWEETAKRCGVILKMNESPQVVNHE